VRLSRQEKQILKQLAGSLRDQLRASEITLYGSAARQELEEGSDIDLLVVLPKVTWEIEKRVSDLCFDAELACGRVVSAVCFSDAELAHSPLRASPLVLAARREGTPL